MQKDKSFFILIAGFVLAIFISSFFKLGFSFFLLTIFISLVLFIYQRFLLLDISSGRAVFLIAIFLLGFGLGILRYEIKDNPNLDINLENKVGQKVVISGIITDESDKRENYNLLTVDFTDLENSSSSTIKVSGRGLIQTDFYPEYKYGDFIKIQGKLEKPENISKDDGRDFDYISYLEKDDIKYKMSFVKTSLISSGHGNIIKSALFKIKNSFTENISYVISEPQSSLLSGILLGAKSSMSKSVSDIFRIAGLSHIVALSGYNITVVSEAIMNTLSFLPRSFAFSGGVLGILLFVIMSGASSTAVRASVMSLIVILAQVTHRKYQIGRALVIAGVAMIIYNPKILVFDISFQLSFLATIAIVYVAPLLEKKFSFITERFGLRNTVAGTLSAQLLVLPLILYKMGILSFVALPANILVLAVIPLTMFFGFFTGVLGFISTILSIPFAWATWFLLTYIIKTASLFASLPFSSVVIPNFPIFVLVILYLFVFAFVWWLKKAQVDRKLVKS
ncbi:MAG: ComEC/Rec2 family competence protein [Candidatus Paceibacterota bacterium]